MQSSEESAASTRSLAHAISVMRMQRARALSCMPRRQCRARVARVPLAVRGAQQRITPDVQIGCVACASGDGRFGGPVWWNTPVGDDDAAPEEHRAQWAQPVRALLVWGWGRGGRSVHQALGFR